MEIVNIDTHTVNLAEYNPRAITDKERDDIKESIKRFGFTEPIVINTATGTLVGGHQRVAIAKELGIESIPATYVDLSVEKEKELNIRLNRNKAEWDMDILADNFNREELEDWGFDDEHLEGLWQNIERKTKVPTGTERVKEEKEEDVPTSRVIVFYEDKRYKEVMAKLAKIENTNPTKGTKILELVKQLTDGKE